MRGRLGRVGVLVGGVAVVLAVVFCVRADAGSDSRPPAPVAGASALPALLIMPLGSSSTVGAGSLDTAGFRQPLEVLLTRDGIAYDMVGSQQSGPLSMADRDHEGHGGWTMALMQPQMVGCHQPSERFRGNVIPFAWFAQGLRLVDISDPFAPKEAGYYVPNPQPGAERASSNDVTIDDRGIIYLVDRLGGVDIIESSVM